MNIIHVVCHDLGTELGCYDKPIRTPHLDRFAQQGAVFRNYHCNSTACSPSRGCVMSGQYAHSNGLMGLAHLGWTLPDACRTLVDELNDFGHLTAHVGLQHERPDARSNRYQVERHTDFASDFTENAVDAAIDFLAGRQGGTQPFYLNVGFIETHPERWGPPHYHDRLPLYEPFMPERAYVPPFGLDTPAGRAAARRFQGAIGYMDHHLGRLFEAIQRLGRFEDSVVLFTTDHGCQLGYRLKGTLYQHGTEIALVLRTPHGPPRDRSVEALLQNIDLAPTLLEAVGCPVPARMQGRSFWPLLSGQGDWAPHEHIFLERNYHGAGRGPHGTPYYDPVRACRTERWLYLRNFAEGRHYWTPAEAAALVARAGGEGDWPALSQPRAAEELFDLSLDPHSTINVAGESRCAQVRRDLAARLERWMRDTADPLLSGRVPDPSGGKGLEPGPARL